MKIISLCLCAGLALAAPLPAFAAADATATSTAGSDLQLKKNKSLVDADGRALGKIYEVDSSKGVVTFMAEMKIYQLPISTLSSEGAKLKTSLTKASLGL